MYFPHSIRTIRTFFVCLSYTPLEYYCVQALLNYNRKTHSNRNRLEGNLGQSRQMLCGWKEDSMLTNCMCPSIYNRF